MGLLQFHSFWRRSHHSSILPRGHFEIHGRSRSRCYEVDFGLLTHRRNVKPPWALTSFFNLLDHMDAGGDFMLASFLRV